MLIQKIYSQLHDNGIVNNSQTFSAKFLKCGSNTFNYLKHKNRDMSLNTQLTCFTQLSKHNNNPAVLECMDLIQSNIKKKYSLSISALWF